MARPQVDEVRLSASVNIPHRNRLEKQHGVVEVDVGYPRCESSHQTDTDAENAELKFTLKMLKSPFLEKKIKSINEFKEFIDRVDFQVDVKSLGDKKRMRSYNSEKLKDFFISRDIIGILLGFFKKFPKYDNQIICIKVIIFM